MGMFAMSPHATNKYRETTANHINKQADRPCVTSPGKRRCRRCGQYKPISGSKLSGGFTCADCVKSGKE